MVDCSIDAIELWLMEWFSKKTGKPVAFFESRKMVSYFEEQWVDSFSFVELTMDAEAAFSMLFNNDEFQNPEFSTIGGLAKIIERRKLS